jgi:hypothetical protein
MTTILDSDASSRRQGLPFKAHPDFKKADVEARQQLFQRLAERIWTLDRLMLVASEQ